jgi:hypothetical protein
MDDVISDDGHQPQGKNLNKAFAGKVESSISEDSSDEEEKEKDYMSKLDKQARKKFKKNKKKDKIGMRDARILTGARTIADNAGMSALSKVSDKSKRIKKGRFSGQHEITKESVHQKLQTRRLAIPQARLIRK